ncbi:ABC transporter ATP-binding protein [Pseudoruegeria sp. SHC-113]|uniref:ABC transporter ATP-binding protein n=1 Tax=Pseudoruegeria sp. SHC-113 TaxID=2855439 RepID=UPI0021BAC67C|nr:ABC transporter ATP-binding protein [Pseudoruegeria sp. SHC-113]MCT8161116.1 ABC transporter ATP-binding protein [Pseudoruegeria sp. SHC-113]
MTEPLMQVKELDMHFPGSGAAAPIRAVDRVSFEVMRGESFGIVGESGSGKTTLGRCLMQILRPTAGSVRYHGVRHQDAELTTLDAEALRAIWRDIRMVFQDPQSSLNPRLRVIDLIGQSLQQAEGLKGKALADRVAALLEQVGLRPEFLLRYPNAFSGGQRQRLGIARALATRPELIIADEAVSALDVSIQAQTLNLLMDLQDELALTYIFIAHDLAVVEHFCDRIAVMYRGRIVELAETDRLFATPRHPYTRALLASVPTPDPRSRKAKIKASTAAPIAAGPSSLEGCQFAPRCAHATDLCRQARPPRRSIGGAEVLCHFAGEI